MSKFKGLFALFFHVGAFLPRLSLYGGPFSLFKVFLLLFSSMWGPFCYLFLLMGDLFSLFECFFCYVFLLLGGLFHHLKAFLLLFSLCGIIGFFSHHLQAFLLLFSSYGFFLFFYGDPFLACHPPTKILARPYSCVSLHPYE